MLHKLIFPNYVLVGSVALIGLPLKMEIFSLSFEVADADSLVGGLPNSEPPLTDFGLLFSNKNERPFKLLEIVTGVVVFPKLNFGGLLTVVEALVVVLGPKLNTDVSGVVGATFEESLLLPKLKTLLVAAEVVVGIPKLNSAFGIPNVLGVVEPNALTEEIFPVAVVPSLGVVQALQLAISFPFTT